jgi:RimJ/RimL family protein N-acetyltransferase
MNPVSETLLDSSPARLPLRQTHEGRVVRLEPLAAAAHAEALYDGTHGVGKEELWRYLFEGPFPDARAFEAYIERCASLSEQLFFAIIDKPSGLAAGYASYLRIEPVHRCIEVGNILYTPRLQQTVGATEAMYLMARHVFDDLGYRRYEWKCNALNAPSRRAAPRLGFIFEGIFRQHMIVKGRNRNTAWYSILDSEWPDRKANFERWLDPGNFGVDGRQKVSLSALGKALEHGQEG